MTKPEPAIGDSVPQRQAEPPQLYAIPWYEGLDMLDAVFQGQRELMARYHEIEESNGSPVIFEEQEGELEDRQVQARLRQLFGFLVQELGEAMQELKLKPWKRTELPTDKEALYGELGDCLHFFVELCITAGMTAEDLHQAYFRMHQKNINRQNSDY